MILSGRKFTKKEIQLIKDTASLCTGISVNELAFTICELLDWKSANGKLKVDSCLKALQKLKEAGEIEIKERKRYARRRKSGIVITERSAPGQNISCGIPDLGGLRFVQVVEDSDKSLWNELLDRYHYIGVKRKFGDTLQFFVKDKYQRILACIEYSPASISLEKRDRWIGWTKEQRQVNIKLVVNNSRFLVLPWVKVKNLSSKILSESLKILPDAWEKQFAYRPVLAETFVDSDKHHGGCYIAANWKGMGLSKGRGRNDCDNQKNLSLKKIFVMPMQDDFRRSLLGEKRKKKTNPKYRLSKEFKTPDSLLKSWYEISIIVLKIAEEFDLKWQKRKRILNSFLLTMLIFRLVLAKNGQSYAHTIASLWDDHKTMGIDLPQEAPISASSFTEARKKLSPEIFKSINSHVTRASEECMEKDNVFKARLFAADGSKLNLPRPLLHHGYEVPMENAYYPQGILSVLYNLKSRSPYDFDLTKKKDERQSALGHLGHLEEGDIVIYDRGYYSYEMLHFHKLRKVDAIFRLPKSLGGEIDQFWDDPVSIDKIIEVFPSQSVMSKLSRRHPCSSFKPIRIRLVKYVVKEKEYVIGTTILDQNISIKKYSDTYHARWGVEELYKTTKTMLNAEFIRSKNENGVLQEIYANFALQSLTRIISNSADDQINHRKVALDCSKTPAVKVNFLNTIQTVQRKIAGLFALSRQTVRNTIEIVFGATSRVYQASRPGRSFPRISMRPTKRLKAV